MKLLSKLLPFLLVFSIVNAQPVEKKIEIRGFGGLNTIAGDFTIKQNECRLAHNIDWGRNLGSISKRYGYDSISRMSGMDSILGIYAAYYSDGSQQLFIVADSTGTGYGNVYITNKGSSNFSADSLTRIWQYWGAQEIPSFAMSGDNVYIVNGQQKGIVWNGGVARTWPPRAPGEPLVVPLNDIPAEKYRLNGQYRYVIYIDSMKAAASQRNRRTYITSPISVKDGKVLLTGFSWPHLDSLLTSLDTTGGTGTDSIRYSLYRTKGNTGRLDRSDTAWLLTDSRTRVGQISDLDNMVIVDSTPDSLLASSIILMSSELVGRDSLGVIRSRLGMPGYKSMDTTRAGGNFFTGGISQADTHGVAYVCSFIDTITMIESDTGRSLSVWADSGKMINACVVTLPRVHRGDTGLMVNLYRAHLFTMDTDTAWIITDSAYFQWYTENMIGLDVWAEAQADPYKMRLLIERIIAQFKGRPELSEQFSFLDMRLNDSVALGPFYLVAQLPTTTREYNDTTQYTELIKVRQFRKTAPPSLLKGIISTGNRLAGWEASRFWQSELQFNPADTISGWDQAAPVMIQRDDGDLITLAFDARGVIRIFKNFSNYNLYQNSNSEWVKTEVSGTFGCIAPHSYARGFSGHYYLSDAGVVRENEGQQLERTQTTELVSAPIRSFDEMSIIEKSNAVGFYYDRKYMLHVPAVGTTYVFDERANAWSTWDMSFDGAVMYGTEVSLGFLPGDTMYFFNGNVLYRYGKTTELDKYQTIADTGIQPKVIWHSAPLFTDPSYNQITKIGLFRNSVSGDSLGARIYNSDSSSNKTQYFAPMTDRYSVEAFPLLSDFYLYLVLFNNSVIENLDFDSTVIDGIDIWYMDQGEAKVN